MGDRSMGLDGESLFVDGFLLLWKIYKEDEVVRLDGRRRVDTKLIPTDLFLFFFRGTCHAMIVA
jgi:hypothetical protein